MSIKICLLKNQTNVICDIREVLDPEENKSLGYVLSDPFIVNYVDTHIKMVDDEQNIEEIEQSSGRLEFGRLFPLSEDRTFKVSYDFVDVIYEPHKDVTESYVAILANWLEEHKKTISLEGTFLTTSGKLTEQQEKLHKNEGTIEV